MKKLHLTLFYAILILEILLVSPISAQNNPSSTVNTSQFNPYNQNYKVNVGDSVNYRYVTIFNHRNNYIESGTQLSNLSYVSFNITQGMAITVKVNSTFGANVKTQIIYNIPNLGQVSSKPFIYTTPFLSKAFDNYSIANQYVQDMSARDPRDQLSISGDYITEFVNNTFTQTTTVTNWKTGWLKSDDYITFYPNGTKAYETAVSQIDNFFGIDLNSIFTIATIVSIPVFFILGALLARKLKKNKKM